MFLWRFEYRGAMAYDLTDLELFLQVVDQSSSARYPLPWSPKSSDTAPCTRPTERTV